MKMAEPNRKIKTVSQPPMSQDLLQSEADAVEEHAAFFVGPAVGEADDVFDGDDSDSVFVA